MADPNNGQGFSGFQQPNSASTEFNAQYFFVLSLLSRVHTSTLVEVMAVTNSGTDIPAGFVDIRPLVNQIDGAGNSVPHGTIYHCPYFRLLGGANAVILDPEVGDIGLACFAERDISSVLANQAQANPGSRRQFDYADGMYVGGFLGQTPTQFVRFAVDGIFITSPAKITLQAPDIEFDGATHTTGAVTGDATATYQGNVTAGSIDLETHKHTGVQTGGGTTGGPVG